MKNAIVYGAGVSGLGAKKLLEDSGYKVYLVDDNTGINSEDALELLEKIDIFVKSPGIPYTRLVLEARSKNIEIIDEIELAYREIIKLETKPKIIAITGTNGKTTVTSKIKEMLEYAGKRSRYAGNIGSSFAELVLEIKGGLEIEYIALELSSYQLENLDSFRADISIIINLAPDHLDRYDTLEDYYKAKLNITSNQGGEDYFILNKDSKEVKKRINNIKSKVYSISREEKSDLYVKQGSIYRGNIELVEVEKLSLKGEHNLENNLFILGVGSIIGLENKEMVSFLCNTSSLEHRMEEFLLFENTIFINDSKGTNIDSTNFAIGAYNRPILICGGVDKKLDLTPLMEKIFLEVSSVYLIGEIASKIEDGLRSRGYEGNIYNLQTLEKVVDHLGKHLDTSKNNIVLLSPATASFDQFKNYIVRGREFKRLIIEEFSK